MPDHEGHGENSTNGGPGRSDSTGVNYPRPNPPTQTGARKPWLLWIFIVFCCLLVVAILWPVDSCCSKSAAQRTVAVSNAKQVALATIMYANDYDDRFPPVLSFLRTRDLIGPYLHDRESFVTAEAGYTWNKDLEGVDETGVYRPEETWLFRTVKPVPGDRYVLAFVDGHAKAFVATDLLKTLGLGHDLAELGADVHQVWRLPKENPSEATRQIDLTKPGDYTAIITCPAPGGKGSVLYVVRGPYGTSFNQFWVGKGTSVEAYRKTHAGTHWMAAPTKMAGVNPTDEANDVKAITVDQLKAGKPVSGRDVTLPPEAR